MSHVLERDLILAGNLFWCIKVDISSGEDTLF